MVFAIKIEAQLSASNLRNHYYQLGENGRFSVYQTYQNVNQRQK